MNVIFFTGNLGRDAESRSTSSGDVLSFGVAVRQGISRDGKDEWYRCSIWGQRGANLKQYLTKGAKVTVVGTLSIGEYEGKPQFNVNVTDIDPWCGGKREGGDDSQPRGGSSQRASGGATGGNYAAGRDNYQPSGGGGGGFADDLDDSVPFITNDVRYERRAS